MMNFDDIFQEIQPLVILHGNNLSHVEIMKDIQNIELVHFNPKDPLKPTRPYIDLFSWETYCPNKLDVLYETLKSRNNLLQKPQIICSDLSNIKKSEKDFLNEVGITSFLSIHEGKDHIQNFFNNEKYNSELVGSYYHYSREIFNNIQSEHIEKVENQLKTYVFSDAFDPKAKLIATAYLFLNKLSEAEKILHLILYNDSSNLWAANQLSLLYIKQSKYLKAIEMMERLEKYHSINPQRSYYLGNLYLKLQNYKRSYYFFQNGITLCPQFAKKFTSGLIKSAIALEIKKDELDKLFQIQKLNTDIVKFISILCKKYFDEDELTKIEKIIHLLSGKIPKVSPIKAKLLYNLGVIKFYQDNLPKSLSAFEMALKINTDTSTSSSTKKVYQYLKQLNDLNSPEKFSKIKSIKISRKIKLLPLTQLDTKK